MRAILFLLLACPFIMNAQINRSATEFAKENISEYITTKLFKSNYYKPISYGELKDYTEKNSGVTCFISHRFEITESEINGGKKTSIQKLCQFVFYFNEKMKIIKAESYYHSD